MGAVLVHVDSFYILAVHVAAQMISSLHHQTFLSLLPGQIGEHTAVKPGSHQHIIVFFH